MNKKMKVLIVTTVASTIDQFCTNDFEILMEDYSIEVAANFSFGNNTTKERVAEFKRELIEKKVSIHEIQFNRNPFRGSNLRAYFKLKKIIEQNKYEIIHCHTPVAAMLTRLAAYNARKTGTKVIYTAHGFHFYNGAPIKNWLVYYPIEKLLSKYTDTLITINQEDYHRAKKDFCSQKIEYVPGVGIDMGRFTEIKNNKSEKRSEIGLQNDVFVILSVGELNKNKNHEVVIKALAKMNNQSIHYLICGKGLLENKLKELAKNLGIEKQVHFLGFRKDISEICNASDLFVFPSYREGLSVALMEAMASGLPVVCSDIRGNSDLIENNRGGSLINPSSIDDYVEQIDRFYRNSELRERFGEFNKKNIDKFSSFAVKSRMKKIYRNL